MKKLQILVLVYGIALIGGGVMGMVKGGSTTSLIVGGTAGALAVVAAILAKDKPSLGYRLAGVVSLAMIILWTSRMMEAINAGKSPMMAGGILAMSVVVFAALGISHMQAVSAKKAEG